ncbi:MAG: glycosyltransferase family 4 protein [Pseudomonadota bacterium]
MAAIDRIVVINDYATPKGGASFRAAQSVRGYRALGYAVTYLTGQAPDPELAELGVETQGVGSEGLLQVSALKGFRQGLHNRDAERMIRDWIKTNDTPGTVYHLHNWGQILSPAVYKALRPVEARMIATCHDFFGVCPNGGFLNFPKTEPCTLRPLSAGCLVSQCDRRSSVHKYWRVARQLHMRRLARFARNGATFSFIHERMKDRYLETGFPARDLVTIPNPVDPWSSKRIEAEKGAGFLFVGRLSKDKGADVALEATKRAGVGIIMVGTGPDAEMLARDYPHATIVGWQAREQIIDFARQARALIMSSRVVEPFGLVVLEAAMSGLPVVSAERAFLTADVVRLGFGAGFRLHDMDDFEATLRRLETGDAEVEAMSRAGFESASQLCHSMDSWIAAHIGVFSRKLGALAAARHRAKASIDVADPSIL